MTITPAVAKATRKLFQLLEDNFDPDAGAYLHGYSDERIAKECGLSVEAVKQHRVNAFGKLKPPNELHLLKIEVDELQRFALQTENDIKARLREINAKLAAMLKRFD